MNLGKIHLPWLGRARGFVYFGFRQSRGCGRKVGRFGVWIGVRMFSMEDRRRAVDLYFTESMTIRKVGSARILAHFGLHPAL